MPISELLLPELDEEMKKTRTTLERVPADKKEFAPHAKSMPLGKLAPHVAQLAGFGVTVLTTPELDFSQGSYKLERKLEAEFSGQVHFRRITISGLPGDVSESSGASPRPAWRVSALER